MIITRTPFRISFAGGGSDLAAYYEKYGGAVLSCSIDKYIYLSMHPYFFKEGYFLKYSEVEHAAHMDSIRHNIIREVFRLYGIRGVDLASSADIPSGTGLASSSAFTVGLIHACNVWNETYISKEDMADQACHVEIDILNEPIGKQDQYGCACGGLNFIEFEPSGKVLLEKVFLTTEGYHRLEHNLLMFYTGQTRAARDILTEQKENTVTDEVKIKNLHKIVRLAHELRGELVSNNIDSMGEALRMGWEYKRELASGISNEFIDKYYKKAIQAGAVGGKVMGSGGGGFLLFYVREENHQRIRNALSDLKELPFKLENKGSIVLHYNKHELKGRW